VEDSFTPALRCRVGEGTVGRAPVSRGRRHRPRSRDYHLDLDPQRATFKVDRQEMTGDFILSEILNTRSVGPNLAWSDADPSDGYFTVVFAGEEHRDELARYLQDRLADRESALELPAVRAREIEIRSLADAHIDDEIVHGSACAPISIRIEAAAIEFLV
jgi:diacylglycerol kinase family enzyme